MLEGSEARWPGADRREIRLFISSIRLNNLASLLQATNRLAEAEQLMRRALAIIQKFTRATGHPYADSQTFTDSYTGILRAMSRGEEQILATLGGMAPEFF